MRDFTQKELLDSLFGQNGDYTKIIMEDGCKLLGKQKITFLLKKVRDEKNLENFNQELDEIFHPNSNHDDAIRLIGLIRAFKTMHDMLNNADVKFGRTKTKPALEYWLDRCAPSVDQEAFKTTIWDLINNMITSIENAKEGEINQTPSINFKEGEINQTPSINLKGSSWRFVLNLPDSQLTEEAMRLKKNVDKETLSSDEKTDSLLKIIAQQEVNKKLSAAEHSYDTGNNSPFMAFSSGLFQTRTNENSHRKEPLFEQEISRILQSTDRQVAARGGNSNVSTSSGLFHPPTNENSHRKEPLADNEAVAFMKFAQLLSGRQQYTTGNSVGNDAESDQDALQERQTHSPHP